MMAKPITNPSAAKTPTMRRIEKRTTHPSCRG
jgi:hypothetical protein